MQDLRQGVHQLVQIQGVYMDEMTGDRYRACTYEVRVEDAWYVRGER